MTNDCDREWLEAHRRIADKYPGAAKYLSMAESVRKQIKSGQAL